MIIAILYIMVVQFAFLLHMYQPPVFKNKNKEEEKIRHRSEHLFLLPAPTLMYGRLDRIFIRYQIVKTQYFV